MPRYCKEQNQLIVYTLNIIYFHLRHRRTGSNDFICCGITSNLKNKNNSVLLENKDMKEGRIPKKSRIKIGNIFTLQKDLAVKQVGKIDSKK